MRQKRFVFACVALVAAVALIGCGGGKGGGTEAAKPAEPAGPTPAEKGQAVGQEIIAAFDGLVAETVRLINENPNADVVMPQLQAMVQNAEPKMAELNARLLALRGEDVESFGAANSYIQDQRPKSVHEKDVAFAPFLMDYPGEDPNGEVKEFLSGKELIRLLDLASATS
ncbi:MAG TPA: hypothetical protein VLA66_03665 [Thermoanaerobaculia bacterium]|nr:hypothetical protein [Thermoanaerobaculia bacterium]